jgi:hypothetical protein
MLGAALFIGACGMNAGGADNTGGTGNTGSASPGGGSGNTGTGCTVTIDGSGDFTVTGSPGDFTISNGVHSHGFYIAQGESSYSNNLWYTSPGDNVTVSFDSGAQCSTTAGSSYSGNSGNS